MSLLFPNVNPSYRLLPIAVHIGLLHRCVILIQKDDHFFLIIAGQIKGSFQNALDG